MRGPHNIWRLIRTLATLERTGATGVVLDAVDAAPRLRIAVRVLSWPLKPLGLRGDKTLPPLTRALTALGPSYIKLGQLLSTRPDIVGGDLAHQLQYLQDQLPPFSIDIARETIEKELEMPLDEVFCDFSEPVAAASIAQVHHARLVSSGAEVAIKVLRPDIERAFSRDIDAFFLIAHVISYFAPSARRLRPVEVVRHFEGVVKGELDLRLEASAASEFAENVKNDKGFSVPQPHWLFCGRRVMTMDWVEGLSLNDTAALDQAGHDRTALAARVLELFLSHALRDGYFHADMHQGNLKIAANSDIIAYDCGIMGRIDSYTRRVYAEILYGFIRRDYRRVAEVHFEAGYVPADCNLDDFTLALRGVGEPIFGMESSRISMARLLSQLFELTERFGMETRTELILLQRTMVVVEGVARGLDGSNVNMWKIAHPVVESYIARSIGPRAILKDLSQTAQVLARFGPKFAPLVERALMQLDAPPPPPPPRTSSKVLKVGAFALLMLALGMAIERFI